MTGTATLLRHVEVGGRCLDVRLEAGRVAAVGLDLPTDDAEVVDGAGGALLPGLHDHHVHLLATAAALTSVDCSPETAPDRAGLAGALRHAAAGAGGWVRGIGYHESIAGALDRRSLDELAPGRPVRIQHRSGALWMLNSRALEAVADVLDDTPDVERDEQGRPNGRLWRYDARLRPALPDEGPPDLGAVGRRLAELGITGVTDATPDLDDAAISLLASSIASGDLTARVTLLGAPTGVPLPPEVTVGPRKILLRDHDLPSLDELVHLVRREHHHRRAVAVHCVTLESLVLTLAALEATGPLPGDRIEHASVAPPEIAAWMARLGVRVVTQPDFLRSRGTSYLTDVDPADRAHLYPYAGLLAAGVPTCPSSDAPFGALDPWRVMASAAERRTMDGTVLGIDESVPTRIALDGYLSSADSPGGPPRRVLVGATADLVLLGVRLEEMLAAPDARHVRATWVRGARVTGP